MSRLNEQDALKILSKLTALKLIDIVKSSNEIYYECEQLHEDIINFVSAKGNGKCLLSELSSEFKIDCLQLKMLLVKYNTDQNYFILQDYIVLESYNQGIIAGIDSIVEKYGLMTALGISKELELPIDFVQARILHFVHRHKFKNGTLYYSQSFYDSVLKSIIECCEISANTSPLDLTNLAKSNGIDVFDVIDVIQHGISILKLSIRNEIYQSKFLIFERFIDYRNVSISQELSTKFYVRYADVSKEYYISKPSEYLANLLTNEVITLSTLAIKHNIIQDLICVIKTQSDHNMFSISSYLPSGLNFEETKQISDYIKTNIEIKDCQFFHSNTVIIRQTCLRILSNNEVIRFDALDSAFFLANQIIDKFTCPTTKINASLSDESTKQTSKKLPNKKNNKSTITQKEFIDTDFNTFEKLLSMHDNEADIRLIIREYLNYKKCCDLWKKQPEKLKVDDDIMDLFKTVSSELDNSQESKAENSDISLFNDIYNYLIDDIAIIYEYEVSQVFVNRIVCCLQKLLNKSVGAKVSNVSLANALPIIASYRDVILTKLWDELIIISRGLATLEGLKLDDAFSPDITLNNTENKVAGDHEAFLIKYELSMLHRHVIVTRL